MYVYEAYGLGIHSDLSFPELLPSDRPADVTIRFEPLSQTPQPHSNGGDYFVGRVADIGMVSVRGGCEICLDPNPGVEEAVLRPLILSPLLSMVLRQRGKMVLHASCVEIGGVGVAFMGASGWGKSTLAEYFHSQGYPLLTDDVMAIDLDGEKAMMIPSFPQIRIMPDSATELGHDLEKLPLLNDLTVKRSHRISQGFRSTPIPLEHLYILEIGERLEIAPLSSQERFVELVRHSRVVSLLDSPEFASAHLHLCTKLIEKVTLSRLQRQRSFAELSELAALIQADLTLCYA